MKTILNSIKAKGGKLFSKNQVKNNNMVVDKNKLREFINTLFPNYRINVTEFDSGAIIIDIYRSGDFIAIQYDGESYIGVSVIPDHDLAAGFGLPDKVFRTIEDFEDHIRKMIKQS